MEKTAAATFKTNGSSIESKDKSRVWTLINGDLTMFEAKYMLKRQDVCNGGWIVISAQWQVLEESHVIVCK